MSDSFTQNGAWEKKKDRDLVCSQQLLAIYKTNNETILSLWLFLNLWFLFLLLFYILSDLNFFIKFIVTFPPSQFSPNGAVKGLINQVSVSSSL